MSIQSCQFDPGLRPPPVRWYSPHADNTILTRIRAELSPKYVWLFLREAGVTLIFPDVMGGLLFDGTS